MSDDAIKRVVVLMLENRSFDHMLGALQDELGLDGVSGAGIARTDADDGGYV